MQALYIAENSIYKELLGEGNCWDVNRDATTYNGVEPIIAHPPCQDWCRLEHQHKTNHARKKLALIAVEQVRRWGGILEHPKDSKLWDAVGLPQPGRMKDEYGGWSACVNQIDFGHVAQKPSWLYIVRCQPIAPPPPSSRKGVRLWTPHKGDNKETPMDEVRKVCDHEQLKMSRKELRDHSPREFAQWLIAIAETAIPMGN